MFFIKGFILLGTFGLIAGQLLQAEPISPAKYSFQYSVADPHTGDNKQQQEERDGDVVRGFYSLIEPDGTLRRVDYTSDAENGFQAVVSKQPGAAHAIPIPVARTAAVVAQPAVHVVSQPATHIVSHADIHAPISTHYVQSAPITRYVQSAAIPTQYIQSSPITTQYVQQAPVSTQIISQAPRIVSSVPQYVTRTIASPSQYVLSYAPAVSTK